MNRWISIKERFPEEKTAVLLFCVDPSEYGDIEEIKIGWWYMVGIKKKGVWTENMQWNFNNPCPSCEESQDITHWMPLPLKPD